MWVFNKKATQQRFSKCNDATMIVKHISLLLHVLIIKLWYSFFFDAVELNTKYKQNSYWKKKMLPSFGFHGHQESDFT